MPCIGSAEPSCSARKGPRFAVPFSDGSPLTKSKFVDKYCAHLCQAGIDGSSYSGHSFCIDAASTAAANGIEDSLIQTLGRWKAWHTLPMFVSQLKILLHFLYQYAITINGTIINLFLSYRDVKIRYCHAPCG